MTSYYLTILCIQYTIFQYLAELVKAITTGVRNEILNISLHPRMLNADEKKIFVLQFTV